MSGPRTCSVCGNVADPRMTKCWVCYNELAPVGAPPAGVYATPGPAPAAPTDDGKLLRALGWLGLILGMGFVAVLVGVELALEWPGLLVPYALVQLVVFGALSATAYRSVRAGGPSAASAAPARGSEIVQGVALGLSITLAVIALLILLAVAAVVLFMMVCFAVIAVGGV